MTERKKIIFITGANGFIGSEIVARLATMPHYEIRASVRQPSAIFPTAVRVFPYTDISVNTDWSTALSKVDCLIHCAARVHVMHEQSSNPLAEFRKVNVEATLNLARQAAAAGVKRFIFLSTIGVNGAQTFGAAYTASDPAMPHSPYAQSKYEAEMGLQEIAQLTGMAVVIIRPPLVYGPNAPGNFGTLLRLVKRGFPLPLGAIRNSRSFIFLGNLVDVIVKCIEHPAAANQIFLVSDDEDMSTTELVKRMAEAVGARAMVIPVPMVLLQFATTVTGKKKIAQQLLGSLKVDISKTYSLLNWQPPFNVRAALEKTANG